MTEQQQQQQEEQSAKPYVKSVCVYCGSSFGTDKSIIKAAEKLGELFYKLNWRLVYGGGTTGLMGTIAYAAMGNTIDGNSLGNVLGVIPEALVIKERNSNSTSDDANTDIVEKINSDVQNGKHNGYTPLSEKYGKTVIVKSMHLRKELMAKESDCFVAMPGGYGTLEEIMECITWSQLGIHDKPIVLFNYKGFYDPLLDFIKKSIELGFISAKNGEIIKVASTADEVIELINNYKIPLNSRFNLKWGQQ
ncbi:Log1p SCDLUD_003566 [Saccharomycodes ludwigii]|uniref:Log1p n=1 Tax=Saccharomycodes ludwigii TaxID=36035 RepID=UPI001E88EE87|nr:hypothetical protein SCDLUD_003566 [Saccharomycodes ludwigii]KAH3900575.1 hypothetical protein SCDLUD_003566 [Saccharomycodes ludwigii]